MITLTLVAELVGLDEEVAFLAYVRRNHLSLFPLLPERSRYNRRALAASTNALRLRIQRQVRDGQRVDDAQVALVGGQAVPVVGFAHACGHHRWRGHTGYPRTGVGYNATKKQTIYGFKLHLLATHSGLILDVALLPANVADGDLTAQLLEGQAHLTVLGDKAYLNTALRERLRREQAIDLLAPTRAKSLSGLCARIQAKLSSPTLGLFLIQHAG